MSGYLSNIALRGIGSYAMNSIRPRKGIFESGNVTAPLIYKYSFPYQAERMSSGNTDFQPPEKAEEHSAMPITSPDSFAPDLLSDPVMENMAPPMVNSNKNISRITHQEMQNVETEPLQNVDHAVRQALNPKISGHSVRTRESSPHLYDERKLGPQLPQQAVADNKAQQKEIKSETTPNGSAISARSPANDVAENLKRDTPINDHIQPDIMGDQEIIEPVSQSNIEQTRISPRRQTSFTRMRAVRKKMAIQSEAQQTVKVKIGKVEVRAVQTPPLPSAPPSPAQVRSGFNDYLSVRNYGFPEY